MLPNLLDDLLRAWDTNPASASGQVEPAPEPEPVEASAPPTAEAAPPPLPQDPPEPVSEPSPSFPLIKPPDNLLPPEPFPVSTAPEPTPAPFTASIMDSLLSSLLASHDSEQQAEELPPPAPPEPVPAAVPVSTPIPKPAHPRATTLDTGLSKFVAVTLGANRYVLPIENVLEAGRYPKVTFVPGLPGYVRGVVNFRGEVLPVIDARLLDPAAPPASAAQPNDLRILAVHCPATRRRAAYVFDTLEGIVSLDLTELDQPSVSTYPLSAALSGICRNESGGFGLISIDRLLELAGIETASQAAPMGANRAQGRGEVR